MSKKKVKYVCSECGYESAGFMGKCPHCQTWGSIEEQVISSNDHKSNSGSFRPAIRVVPLMDIKTKNSERLLTGLGEFDRVMGGGIVRDSVSILTAKPGAGKSTLLLQISNIIADMGHKVLYASGEESESQIKARADRILEKISADLWVVGTNSLEELQMLTEQIDPKLIIVDSIQTMQSEALTGRPGSPSQTMACAQGLVDLAKNYEKPRMVFMVGQMTKEDELAGVRALEHLVDTVLMMETDDAEELRMLTASKNRYGSTGEVGFFEMTEEGMVSIDNPSAHFMTKRDDGEPIIGSALTVIKEGTRPIILEIESLVSQSFTPYPARVAECLRREHLNTLVSLLEERGKMNLYDKNVVIKTTGGIFLREPSTNLATIMSIASSLKGIGLPSDTLFLADVSLTGELRTVPMLNSRLKEGERMGFKRAFVAEHNQIRKDFKEMEIVKVPHLMSVINRVIKPFK